MIFRVVEIVTEGVEEIVAYTTNVYNPGLKAIFDVDQLRVAPFSVTQVIAELPDT